MRRKERLENGKMYHIFNKSIADYKIFSTDKEYLRARNLLKYYQGENIPFSYSRFMESEKIKESNFDESFVSISQKSKKIIQIIAYCFMPTHLHLILKQLKDKGIATFMGNILNSYSRYFNTKYKRKGPLWQSRFQSVLVENDEQLLHLSRYIHLNPVTAYLVEKPQRWVASSYREYLLKANKKSKLCDYKEILDIEPAAYKDFVEDAISYQRELATVKELFLD